MKLETGRAKKDTYNNKLYFCFEIADRDKFFAIYVRGGYAIVLCRLHCLPRRILYTTEVGNLWK